MEKEILTERTILVPFTADHIPTVIEMWREPDSNKFIEPLLKMSEDLWLEKLEKSVIENNADLQYWSVYHLETDEYIGSLNLNKFSLTGQDQIGVHLARDFWNQGYATELCDSLLKYAVETKKLKVLHWIFELGHDVSKKLALKLGFEPFEEMMDGDCELRIYRKNLVND
jgi:RimJ/RimL family protein N-acetyltransferase